MNGKVYVLLPALNESEALSSLIPAIAQALEPLYAYRLVVIDDGSTDATTTLAAAWRKRWPLEVLRHPTNKGYGAALRTGYEWALKEGGDHDIVVSLDADNTHRPDYIPALVKKLEEGYDVVTASYWMPGGHMTGVPWKRHVMSYVVNQLFRLVLPVKGIRCFTNGFRAYRLSVLRAVQKIYGSSLIEQTGFPGGAELFVKVCRQRVRAGEIPFVLHYENRGSGSKIRLWATISGYLRLLAAGPGSKPV